MTFDGEAAGRPRRRAEEKYGDDSDPLTWQQMYWDQIAALPTMRMLRARVVEDQLGDDHDFSKNDGESQYPWTGPAGSEYNRGFQRSIQMQAMQALFAMHLTQGPGIGLYASYLLTPHVRVVLTDAESLQRAPGEVADDNAKTFLGGSQDD